jgi:hypothetical protein
MTSISTRQNGSIPYISTEMSSQNFDDTTIATNTKSYIDSLETCQKLASTINSFHFIHDAAYHVVEEACGGLVIAIEKKRDMLKSEIDAKAGQLLADIEAYRLECKKNILERHETASELRRIGFVLESRRGEIDEMLRELKENLSSANAMVKCEMPIDTQEMIEKVEQARKVLLLNKFEEFEARQLGFSQLNLLEFER